VGESGGEGGELRIETAASLGDLLRMAPVTSSADAAAADSDWTGLWVS
jgi:hypothetical protein